MTNEFFDRPQLLISDLSEKRKVNSLRVKLVGTRSNRDGLGTVVTVRAGGRVWNRYHDGKSGYLGQSSAPVYFGLGDTEKVDEIQVTWPSGRQQKVAGPVAMGETVLITEPEMDR